jgi:hypothetical protein
MYESQRIYSKKIFFVYPVSIVYDFLKDLIRYGYEVYVIKDHTKLPRLAEKYHYSIAYINIFEKMNAKGWESFIKSLIGDKDAEGLQIGICTYSTSDDDELSVKYLLELGLTGGYINLHTSYKKSLEKILKILEASEARGNRKFVRVKPFTDDNNTHVLININDKVLQCRILDISISCLSIELTGEKLVKNQILRDSIVKLRGVPCHVDLLVKGFHSDNNDIYILFFVIEKENIKSKIFDYIYERLQSEIQNV